MAKELTLKHYKNYDKVTINVVNRKNFLKAAKMAKNNDREATMIGISKKAFQDYKNVYREDMKIKDTPVGESFEIMGVVFKNVSDKLYSDYTNRVTLQYNNPVHEFSDKEIFTMLYGQSLIEQVFQAVTGTLLFF